MKLNSIWLNKADIYYKIASIFVIFFIGNYFSVLQASGEVTEVLYMQPARSSDLSAVTEDQIKTAKLYIQGKENEIEFISEKTKFKFGDKVISFKEQPSNFLEKIRELYECVKKIKGHSKFNHLCLTLYAIYQKQGTEIFEITESPLFARKSKKYSLNAQGDLVINSQRKVIFYTKTRLLDSDQWAYFTTHDGLTSSVKKDPSVFPISADSYECGEDDCNVVCKKFFHTSDSECPHENSNQCRHTEPHALYHIIKHSKQLFSPLIQKAGSVSNIKSVGLRFFSYYQTCSSCVELLSKDQEIEIADNQRSKLNYMFYFYYMYGAPPVIKINTNEINLFNSYNQYLFRGFLKNNVIYYDNPDEEEEPTKDGDVKGYFELSRDKDLLRNNSKIVSIYYLGLKRFRIYFLK